MNTDHFHGKDALHHIVEVQADGKIISSEFHGQEPSGKELAAYDAAKEVALILGMVGVFFSAFPAGNHFLFLFLASLGCAFSLWKFGRAALLQSARLERLHRIVAEEETEIRENRPQEREELRALYEAKGFQGKLLDDVISHLFADSDRVLRVMLQEEMGFRLEENDHPLILGLSAFTGAFVTTAIVCSAAIFTASSGLIIAALCVVAYSAGRISYKQKNHTTQAIVWNVGAALLSFLVVYLFTTAWQR